jgi:hypothetical protein
MSISFINYSLLNRIINKVYTSAKQLHHFTIFVIASVLINYKILNR